MSEFNEIKHPLLDALSARERSALLDRLGVKHHRAGALLLRAGQSHAPVLLLLSGLAISRQSLSQLDVATQVFAGPAVLGDAAALAKIPPFESVYAHTPTRSIRLPRRRFLHALQRFESWPERLYADAATRLARLQDGALSGHSDDLRSLLADLLEALLTRDQAGRFASKLSQSTMARLLGRGRTRVNAEIGGLQEAGLLAKQQGRYEALNREGLVALGQRSLSMRHTMQNPSRRKSRSSQRDRLRAVMPIPLLEAAQSPFYAAQLFGEYERAGLRVDILQPESGQAPIEMVRSGQVEVGVVGGPELVLVARGAGVPLRIVALLHRQANFIKIISPKASGLDSPRALRGKRVGFNYGHVSTEVLRMFLRAVDVEVQEVDVGYDTTAFLRGEVDAQWGFSILLDNEIELVEAQPLVIDPAHHGIPNQGYTLFTTEELLEQRRDELKRFLHASMRGLRHCLEAPSRIISRMRSAMPNIDPINVNLNRLLAYNRVTPCSPRFPPGDFDYELLKPTYDCLLEGGRIKRPYDLRQAYTRALLPTWQEAQI